MENADVCNVHAANMELLFQVKWWPEPGQPGPNVIVLLRRLPAEDEIVEYALGLERVLQGKVGLQDRGRIDRIVQGNVATWRRILGDTQVTPH